MRFICMFGVMVFGVMASSFPALATTIQDQPGPCWKYFNTEAVFTGKVVAITYSEPIEYPEHPDMLPLRRRITRFSIISAHRGITGGTVEVVAMESIPMPVVLPNGEKGMRFETCETDVRFELGEEYLVYADRYTQANDPGLGNGLVASQQTRKLEDAAEDLEYIRGLGSAAPGSLLHGSVWRRDYQSVDELPIRPIANVRVVADGPGGPYSATTDVDGRYRLAGLPPGDYSVHVELPSHLSAESAVERVTLEDRGCGFVSFSASSTSGVLGTVVDANGQVVSGMSVELLRTDRRHSTFPEPLSTASDEQGRFEFVGVAPGTYVLGIGLDGTRPRGFRYARTFFPGTENPDEATVITIEDGKAPETFVIKLPKPLRERTIAGVALLPDGKPARRAIVLTVMTAYPFDVQGPGTVTDEFGRFKLTVAEGQDYAVGATIDDGSRNQQHAVPIDVEPSGDVRGLRLVIAYTGGHGLSPRQLERESAMIREYRAREQEEREEESREP